MHKKFKEIIISVTTISVVMGLYLFSHSTPQRLIRSELFLEGHVIDAFRTEIFKAKMDPQYGQMYSCKNPALGQDFYSFTKKNGFWYINWNGTGGG